MKFIESGVEKAPSIMFIHGMGCTGEHSFQKAKEKLEDKYKIIIVCLDGYDDKTSTFTSISDQAEKIANYIINNYNGKIHMILGMSMGGFITLELLSKYNIEADKVILDSGYLKPRSRNSAKIMSILVAWGFDKLIKGKTNFFIKNTMKKTMGYCFKKEDLCNFASKSTLKNSEYSCLTFQLPNLSKLLNTDIEYWYGTKDKNMIEGMLILKEKLPNIKEVCLGEYGHGEFMFEHSGEYGEKICKSLMGNFGEKFMYQHSMKAPDEMNRLNQQFYEYEVEEKDIER